MRDSATNGAPSVVICSGSFFLCDDDDDAGLDSTNKPNHRSEVRAKGFLSSCSAAPFNLGPVEWRRMLRWLVILDLSSTHPSRCGRHTLERVEAWRTVISLTSASEWQFLGISSVDWYSEMQRLQGRTLVLPFHFKAGLGGVMDWQTVGSSKSIVGSNFN